MIQYINFYILYILSTYYIHIIYVLLFFHIIYSIWHFKYIIKCILYYLQYTIYRKSYIYIICNIYTVYIYIYINIYIIHTTYIISYIIYIVYYILLYILCYIILYYDIIILYWLFNNLCLILLICVYLFILLIDFTFVLVV